MADPALIAVSSEWFTGALVAIVTGLTAAVITLYHRMNALQSTIMNLALNNLTESTTALREANTERKNYRKWLRKMEGDLEPDDDANASDAHPQRSV